MNKSVKNLLTLLASGAIIAVSVINFKVGLTSYGKSSSSLLTLEALASGEASGGSEIGQYSGGKWESGTNTHVRYWKDLSTGICYDERRVKRTFQCGGIVLNPVYAICGTIEYVVQEIPASCSLVK
jgi:hypothetical protein